jgi:hypothetical protein
MGELVEQKLKGIGRVFKTLLEVGRVLRKITGGNDGY